MSVLSEINEGAEVIITFKGRKKTNGYGDRYVELSQNSALTEVFLSEKAVSVELAPEPTLAERAAAAPVGSLMRAKVGEALWVKIQGGSWLQIESGGTVTLESRVRKFEDDWGIDRKLEDVFTLEVAGA